MREAAFADGRRPAFSNLKDLMQAGRRFGLFGPGGHFTAAMIENLKC